MRQAKARAADVVSAQPRLEVEGPVRRWARGNPPPKAKALLGPIPKPPPETANRKRGPAGEGGAVVPK
eukprot:3051341-Alexandrium_andersonii.AAC.1